MALSIDLERNLRKSFRMAEAVNYIGPACEVAGKDAIDFCRFPDRAKGAIDIVQEWLIS